MTKRDPRRRAPQSSQTKIETVATAAAIIDFIAECGEPVGVLQVSQVLEITKSRASRHLSNLETLGLVTRIPNGRRYQLGWRAMRWGHIASTHMDISTILSEPLQKLNEKTKKTVLICGPANGEAIVLKCLKARTDITIDVKVGLILTLPHSPSARVCYAFQPPEQRTRLLQLFKQREDGFRIEDEDKFKRLTIAVQKNYYCWDSNKYNIGYGAIAAPIFNQHETLAGIITLMLPSDLLDQAHAPQNMIDDLLSCCEDCSHILGSHIKFPRTEFFT